MVHVLRWLRIPMGVLFLLCCGGSFAGAQVDPMELGEPWPPVLERSEGALSFPSGAEVEVPFLLKSEPGVHLYREKSSVSVDEAEGLRFLRLVLPEGKEIADPFEEGKTLHLLEGKVPVTLVFSVEARPGDAVRVRGRIRVQGCTDEICYPPAELSFDVRGTALGGPEEKEGAGSGGAVREEGPPPSAGPAQNAGPVQETGEDGSGSEVPLSDILLKILGAFGIGILLSLTPCVLPVIPITSAVILRYSRGGLLSALLNSCLYVFGLAVTYALAGMAVAFVGGSVRSILSSPYVLGAIAAVFVLLSLSMFGLFEIAMPSSVTSKVQQRAARGGRGVLGLLFMGALSGLVIGPCITAPIVGLLIWVAQTGSPVVGFFTMFSLAWGMGLLIILAGTFTGLVPKAGPWMEWFRRFFGFVLLWGALYFLDPLVGDTVYEAGSVFLLLAAAVFLGGLDSLAPNAGWVPRVRRLIGLVCVMGAFFLAFDLIHSGEEGPAVGTGVPSSGAGFRPGGAAEFEAAAARGRPAVLYFTADWCALCKTLKKRVLHRPEVVRALRGMEAVQVDFDEEKELVKRFDVKGPPTVIFVGRDGKERRELRFSGAEETPASFLERLRRLKDAAVQTPGG